MITKLMLITFLINGIICAEVEEDYEETTTAIRVHYKRSEYEPKIPKFDKKKTSSTTPSVGIDCDSFATYSIKCTTDAALMYNSTRKTPPLPSKIGDWCKAIKHLVNCAIDWNTECKEVTDAHFNEESVTGHMHVITNICDNEWFLLRYDDLYQCIENTEYEWEDCYTRFKAEIDYQKGTRYEWTHYETHFHLCCARSVFRRCTLDTVWDLTKCPKEQALILQKFSVIVSQGDVFQDCDHNVMYENCPGGDPRPKGEMLLRYMDGKPYTIYRATATAHHDVPYRPFLIHCALITLSSFFI